MTDPMRELFGEPISVYTRRQAISDGVLVDVSEVAREAGFSIPVALTAAVHADCVVWTDEDEKRKSQGTGQDEAGRLWDVLWMASAAIRRRRAAAPGDNPSTLGFQLLRVPREGRGVLPRLVTLDVHVGPGDGLEPVVTILQPGED
jgi:hypothetical protein